MTDLLKRFLEKKWTPYPSPKTQQENIINWLAYLIRDLALEVQEATKLAREARDKEAFSEGGLICLTRNNGKKLNWRFLLETTFNVGGVAIRVI